MFKKKKNSDFCIEKRLKMGAKIKVGNMIRRLFSRLRGENLDFNSRVAVCIEKWMDLNLTFWWNPEHLLIDSI